MASYRYWRSYFFRSNQFNPSGNNATVVVEIGLYNSVGTDLVVGAGGTASASDQGYSSVNNAFDGNFTSGAWGGGGNSALYVAWAQYDFGVEKDISTFSWTLETSNSPQGGYMLASHDGVKWDLVSDYVTWPFPTAITTINGTVLATPNALNAQSPAGLGVFSLGALPPMGCAKTEIRSSGDFTVSGPGTIAGVVDFAGTPNTPVRRRVRLHSATGACVRETWSDPVTGAYSFSNLDVGQSFYVVAMDYEHNYNAVVKDNLTPEVSA